MTSNDKLIIFVMNPEKLAGESLSIPGVSADQAALIYKKIHLYTKEITKHLNCEKAVYYSDYIDNNDLWDNMMYDKALQQGEHPGEKMTDAFTSAFAQGKDRVLIITADCPVLETYMIKEAFAVLESNDVVLGPSRKGGYYLIGMRKFYPTLFEGKQWDAENILMDTLIDLKKLKAKYYLLKTLDTIQTSTDFERILDIKERPDDWF